MTDLLLNYALKFPVDAALPAAAAEAAGQCVVKQWTSSPRSTSQSAQQQPVEPHTAARLWDTEDFIWLPGAAHTGRTLVYSSIAFHLFYRLWIFIFIYFLIRRSKELFWSLISFRNFHLWFANMGSSCGFSRGNIVVVLLLLLLLDGKLLLSAWLLHSSWGDATLRWRQLKKIYILK